MFYLRNFGKAMRAREKKCVKYLYLIYYLLSERWWTYRLKENKKGNLRKRRLTGNSNNFNKCLITSIGYHAKLPPGNEFHFYVTVSFSKAI